MEGETLLVSASWTLGASSNNLVDCNNSFKHAQNQLKTIENNFITAHGKMRCHGNYIDYITKCHSMMSLPKKVCVVAWANQKNYSTGA